MISHARDATATRSTKPSPTTTRPRIVPILLMGFLFAYLDRVNVCAGRTQRACARPVVCSADRSLGRNRDRRCGGFGAHGFQGTTSGPFAPAEEGDAADRE